MVVLILLVWVYLLNNVVGQQKHFGRVIMPLFILPPIFQSKYLGTPLFPSCPFFPKQEPRFILETKVSLKLSSYKLKGT
jgi:hypothetical protein